MSQDKDREELVKIIDESLAKTIKRENKGLLDMHTTIWIKDIADIISAGYIKKDRVGIDEAKVKYLMEETDIDEHNPKAILSILAKAIANNKDKILTFK